MLKKAREEKASDEATIAKDLSRAVLESPRHVWLAGLGALSRAQAEGTRMFELLVKQGESVEANTRHAAGRKAAAAREAAQAKAKEMQQMAGGTWDKLEKVFEDRVARALSRLGVHTQSDVDRLAARVDALSDAVNELIKQSGGSPARQVRGRPAAKRFAAGAAKAPGTATGGEVGGDKTTRRTARRARKTAGAAVK